MVSGGIVLLGWQTGLAGCARGHIPSLWSKDLICMAAERNTTFANRWDPVTVISLMSLDEIPATILLPPTRQLFQCRIYVTVLPLNLNSGVFTESDPWILNPNRNHTFVSKSMFMWTQFSFENLWNFRLFQINYLELLAKSVPCSSSAQALDQSFQPRTHHTHLKTNNWAPP